VLRPGIDSFTLLEELFGGADEGTWERVSTDGGYVLHPGVDRLAALRKRSCGEDEGIHISLPPRRIYVDGFIMQGSEVLDHPCVSCLILLINTVGIIWVLWSVVLPWSPEKTDFG